MNVKELIIELEKLPPDSEVIVQKDAEGNGYSPLDGVDGDVIYVPESSYSGEVYSTEWTAGDACMDPDEWEAMKKKAKCVVLYPTN